MGAVRIAMPTPKHRTAVIGIENRMLIAQLIKPTTMPSKITMPWISPLEAPTARITPISRVRSSTAVYI